MVSEDHTAYAPEPVKAISCVCGSPIFTGTRVFGLDSHTVSCQSNIGVEYENREKGLVRHGVGLAEAVSL